MNKLATIMCAVDDFGGFGANGKLPWECRDDLKHFARMTAGGILIMGRNTWVSMPQEAILKNRKCIVISSGLNDVRVNVVRTTKEAMDVARAYEERIFIIGGPSIITESILLKYVDAAVITTVHGKYGCTVTFMKLSSLLDQFFKESMSAAALNGCTVRTYTAICMDMELE